MHPRTWPAGAALLLICLALVAIFATRTSSSATQPCEKQSFEGTSYVVCTIDAAGSSDLHLFWKDDQGKPYRLFSNIDDALHTRGQRLAFAVNAGMYDSDFSPLGLYVEDGHQLRPVNTSSSNGGPAQVPNFYKKPNGVFFFGNGGAGVLPTSKFLQSRPDARFATQSGPMLVIDNKLHPALIPGSADRTRRSGVGVCEGGRVRFAISDGDVNFYDFARLFRDQLRCPNALFLDGGHGVGLYEPVMGRNDVSWHGGYGPIFGFVSDGG